MITNLDSPTNHFTEISPKKGHASSKSELFCISRFKETSSHLSPLTSLSAEFQANLAVNKSPKLSTPRKQLLDDFDAACDSPCQKSSMLNLSCATSTERDTLEEELFMDEPSELGASLLRPTLTLTRTVSCQKTETKQGTKVVSISKMTTRAMTKFTDMLTSGTRHWTTPTDTLQVGSCKSTLRLESSKRTHKEANLSPILKADERESKPVAENRSKDDTIVRSKRTLCSYYQHTKMRRTQSDYSRAKSLLSLKVSPTPSPPPPTLADQRHDCILPSELVDKDAIRRITPDTLVDMIDGKFKHLYDDHYIIDCRFPYEYEGGHIQHAQNFNSFHQLEKTFLNQQILESGRRIVIIFHCEFSSHRAPRMALHLRNQDRHMNLLSYPKLHYPDIYILEGGYKNFFNQQKTYCEPQEYVEMKDDNFKEDLRRELSNYRRNTSLKRTRSRPYTPDNDESLDSAFFSLCE